MKTFTYKVLHIATNKIVETLGKFLSRVEFLESLNKWNQQSVSQYNNCEDNHLWMYYES